MDKDFGLRKPPYDLKTDKEIKNVLNTGNSTLMKEALKWDCPSPEGKIGRKTIDYLNQIQMERSPQKWKTMYRDQYRKFMESPGKHA